MIYGRLLNRQRQIMTSDSLQLDRLMTRTPRYTIRHFSIYFVKNNIVLEVDWHGPIFMKNLKSKRGVAGPRAIIADWITRIDGFLTR